MYRKYALIDILLKMQVWMYAGGVFAHAMAQGEYAAWIIASAFT